MIKSDMNPYSIPPSALTLNHKPILQKILQLRNMADDQIIPVTFGDVVYVGHRKYSILSGDESDDSNFIRSQTQKIIFALNVDGIFTDLENRRLIRHYNSGNAEKFARVKADVTGGMRRKVREALKIASLGLDVWLVNGLKPKRIAGIMENVEVEGTVIKGKRGNTWSAYSSDSISDIDILQLRKKEGISIPLNNDVQAKESSNYLEYVKLIHNALPELDYDGIDNSLHFSRP